MLISYLLLRTPNSELRSKINGIPNGRVPRPNRPLLETSDPEPKPLHDEEVWPNVRGPKSNPLPYVASSRESNGPQGKEAVLVLRFEVQGVSL
jgi:hypothetical protein